jgi:hypothetical protein
MSLHSRPLDQFRNCRYPGSVVGRPLMVMIASVEAFT